MATQQLDYTAADDVLAEIAKLRAENGALKAAKSHSVLTLRVSAKGAVSVYGMGRWPVTLYAEQWTRLLASAKSIEAFIAMNAKSLSHKGDAKAEQTEAESEF